MDDAANLDAVWSDLRCTRLDEAVWFRSVLQAAGIEAVIPDEHTRLLPLAGARPDGVRVLVRSAELERALDVLAAHPMPAD